MLTDDFNWTCDSLLSPFRWTGNILIFTIFSLVTAIEYLFCGRFSVHNPPSMRNPRPRVSHADSWATFRATMAPKPLTAEPRRALSDSGGGARDAQQGSTFCARVPAELRVLVYKFVIMNGSDGGGSDVFHILDKECRVGFWRCREPVMEGKGLAVMRGCSWDMAGWRQ